eukprot:1477059-Rhodomonas_salina.1
MLLSAPAELSRSRVLCDGMVHDAAGLRACCVMLSTDIAYAPTSPRASYAMTGTDIAYGPTRTRRPQARQRAS